MLQSLVKDGISFRFHNGPQPSRTFKNTPAVHAHSNLARTRIPDLLVMAVTSRPPRPQGADTHTQSLHVIIKPERKLRIALDLSRWLSRWFNAFVAHEDLVYETVRSSTPITEPPGIRPQLRPCCSNKFATRGIFRAPTRPWYLSRPHAPAFATFVISTIFSGRLWSRTVPHGKLHSAHHTLLNFGIFRALVRLHLPHSSSRPFSLGGYVTHRPTRPTAFRSPHISQFRPRA
jgi:hypothetical protein